ncbi:hypothetical protein CLU79DRAFT_839544 [Phycomyces nitens]|nr:hypothetical protein CLU79DRAFT_839544 [Phycomyces nitens]
MPKNIAAFDINFWKSDIESNTPWASSHEEIDVDYEIEYGELRAPVKNSMLQLVFQVGPHGCASRNIALLRIGCEYCEVLKFDLTRQRPVGLYWFDGYRPAHFGVGAQQEGKHSVAYFMMDIKVCLCRNAVWSRHNSPRVVERRVHCLLALGCIVVSAYTTLVTVKLFAIGCILALRSSTWRRLIWCRSELLRTANQGVSSAPFSPLVLGFRSSRFSGIALCSVVSKFPVIGFHSRISLFAGFSAAGSCLRGGIKCP